MRIAIMTDNKLPQGVIIEPHKAMPDVWRAVAVPRHRQEQEQFYCCLQRFDGRFWKDVNAMSWQGGSYKPVWAADPFEALASMFKLLDDHTAAFDSFMFPDRLNVLTDGKRGAE